MSERSHGKARPALKRARDLKPANAAQQRTADRDANGRFIAGNGAGVGRGLTRAIVKGLGSETGERDVEIVARDARRIYGATMRTVASDAPSVRGLVAMHARHLALHAFFTVAAERAGLTTPEGLRLLDVADRQSARAERTLVTALDVARVCAEQERNRPWRASAQNSHAAPPRDQSPAPGGAASGDSLDVDADDEPTHSEPVATVAPSTDRFASATGSGTSADEVPDDSSRSSSPRSTTAKRCVGDTHDDAERVHGANTTTSDRATVNRSTAPQLAPHLAELNAPNPHFVAAQQRQQRINDERARTRRRERQ